MSSNTPFGSAGGPEYLGPEMPSETVSRAGGGKKWVALGAAVGVAGVVGLGGWAAVTLMSGGSQPANAIPASAVAYASLDLDPAATQKIEAFKILNKFPGIKKEMDLKDRDDVREWVFTSIQEEGQCKDLDYAKDVQPWIGDRIAVAAVPSAKGESAAPVVALQVTDAEAAADGITALAECGEAGEEFGFAFTGDYVVITDSEERAQSVVEDAEQASLADDAQFQVWTESVGDPGIVTMYASAAAPEYFIDLQGDAWFGYVADEGGAPLDPQRESDGTRQQMKELYKDFDGMAGVVRFEDGAVEAEFAGRGAPDGFKPFSGATGPNVTELPVTTAAAFSVALADGWFDMYLRSMAGVMGEDQSTDELLAEAEAATGLELPEDLERLLGDGASLSVDGGVDLDSLFETGDPTRLPVGLRVSGDPDEIMPVVRKLRAALGPEADALVVEEGDGVVAFGLSPDYVKTLAGKGALGDQVSFQQVVPEPEKANAVLYVDFDAGNGWAEEVAQSIEDMASGLSGDKGPSSTARDNVAPLDALGVSSWLDGDVERGLFRLTTD